jgi:hypothetical protein
MHENKLEKASITSIYTAASGRILQFLGASLVLALFAFPFGLGLIGLFFSLPALGLPPLVFLPISLAGLFVSGYLLSRFGLSQVIVVATENGVIESLKTSSRLTKKNKWKIFFGTFLLIILYLIFLTLIQFLLNLNQSVSQNQFISNFVYVIEAIILVPTFFIFQTELYKELNG